MELFRNLFDFAVHKLLLNKHTYWLILAYFVAKLLFIMAIRFYKQSTFGAKVKQRRAECDESFQPDFGKTEISEKLQQEILHSDISQLRDLIWSKKVSSESVLKFFYQRSKTIGRDLGSAVDSNIAAALVLAKKADQLIKSKKREDLPPLCGVPFSVKENYYMEGFENTMGLETRLGVKATRTAPIVSHLVEQGGVPFVRSNIPQFLMAAESVNSIYGRALNPHNKKRSPGGSSGGEAALVSSGCSCFGLGNDVGGSLRIPALFCGLFTFKGTSNRMEYGANCPAITVDHSVDCHQNFISVVNGVIAKSVEDLQLVSPLLHASKINSDLNPSIPRYAWRTQDTHFKEGSKLRIAYYESLDAVFPASKAHRRAVREVVEALKKQGHTLVPIEIPRIKEIFDLCVKIFLSDGTYYKGFNYRTGLVAEQVYFPLMHLYNAPTFLIKFAAFVYKLIGQPRMSESAENVCYPKTNEIFALGTKQYELQREFLGRMAEEKVDAIISPGLGLPAYTHDTLNMNMNAAYTLVWNLFGLPTGVLPVTKVRSDEQTYDKVFDDEIEHNARHVLEGSEGMPVGVQVTALPWKDEECMALMSHIQKIMSLKAFTKF